MNLKSRSPIAVKRPGAHNGSEVRLQRSIASQQHGEEGYRQGIPLRRGYQRIIARGLWLAIAGLSLWLFIASMPYHAEHLHVLCENILCGSSQTVPQVTQQLHAIGLTRDFFTDYTIMIESIFALIYFVIAAIIFWRKSDDLMALLVSAFLITFVLALTDIPQVLEHSNAWIRWLAACMGFVGEMTFPLCFYLFPNGRFVPRWTRWLLPGWFLWGIIEYFFPGASFRSSDWFLLLEGLAFAAGLGSMVFSQVYRYRFVSSRVQKQQTKWVVFGMVTALVGFFCSGFVGFVVPSILLPAFSQPDSTLPVILSIFANGSIYLVMLLIPITLAIAIMRYRLWEIDAIINKALVYGLLSVLLAAIYVGLIIGLESLVGLYAAKNSQPIVIVVSTLVIAALFQPLRHRIQQIIDRRFYRRKYDAARTLEVVQETMQPTYVSLWLRQDEERRQPNTDV